MMITVSLCMIVKNEENNIKNCINSVKDIVDEIIIADTGSTDNTKKICQELGCNVYDFKWINDFSKARNFAFSKAKMEFILWLDADDIILHDDKIKFLKLKKNMDDDVNAVMMKYNTGFDEKGNVTFSYYRERLVRRTPYVKWVEPVHEYIKFKGKVITKDICITHAKKQSNTKTSTRNIDIYEKYIQDGNTLSPRANFYYARELKEHSRFNDAIIQYKKFLNDNKGWIEDNITACNDLAICYVNINKNQQALLSLFKSFEYDTPRAEACCQIGYYFKNQGNYKLAIFWFELIFTLNKPENSWGFFNIDCWGYIPSLECAVCYDKLGNIEKAEYYNNKAAEYKPDSKAVIFNKKYFETLKNQNI